MLLLLECPLQAWWRVLPHHIIRLLFTPYQPFPVSPRNPPAAVINMMKKINTSRIVTLQHAHQTLIDGVREQLENSGLAFTVDEIPTVSYAFPKLGREVEADLFVPYPPSASRPDPNAPLVYVHSSGSTGFPKPIPQSYKFKMNCIAHCTSILPAIEPHDSDRHRYGAGW